MANVIKMVGVASKITAANEQHDQHKTKVILSVSNIFPMQFYG